MEIFKLDSDDPRIGNENIEDPGEGIHLWMIFSCFRVDPTKVLYGSPYELTNENLITIEGPGCFKCEEVYSPERAGRRCTGSMTK